jgi:hypothetical protein
MFKIIIAAAIAIMAFSTVAEAGERRAQAGYSHGKVYKPKKVNRAGQYRPSNKVNVYNRKNYVNNYRPHPYRPNKYRPNRNNINNGNINNSFNKTYKYNYGNDYDINPWAAAGIGFLGGALVGAIAAEPGYGYAEPGYPVQGVNTVPGCYYAAFVDQYGRQYFQQICN